MDNALVPFNRNALRDNTDENYSDLSQMLRAKQMAYANMGLTPQEFAPLMEIEMRKDPRIAMMLMGNSGNLIKEKSGLGFSEGMSPAMLMARLGLEHNGARAGVSGMAMKLPNEIKTMPGAADVGYSTPLMGGNLDVNGYYGLAPSPSPNYGMNLKYNKSF